MKRVILILCLFCQFSFAQTKFAFEIDTLFLSGKDKKTVLDKKNYIFNPGDTVKVNYWCVSDDSLHWFALFDSNNNIMYSDSVLIDTLPLHKFYCAVLTVGSPIEYVVWKVSNVAYKVLEKPKLTNDANISKANILLLRYDTIRFDVTFKGLQPDSIFWHKENTFYSLGKWNTTREVTKPVIYSKGDYFVTGYIYNRHGEAVDSAASEKININFEYPLSHIIFKSWRGSNDGKPRLIDTLYIDTCDLEIVIDTLVFAVGDAYKYQFVPVIHSFDKAYNFTYKWEYSGFAFVNTIDSVLEFNPIRFEHTGSYVFVTSWKSGSLTTMYKSQPVRIVAFNTGNELVSNSYILNATVYNATGAAVFQNVSGYYYDIIRDVRLPGGVYFLKTRERTYKFIK